MISNSCVILYFFHGGSNLYKCPSAETHHGFWCFGPILQHQDTENKERAEVKHGVASFFLNYLIKNSDGISTIRRSLSCC